MANNLKGNEARNRDPELDKSKEQIQRIRERLEKLSLSDYLELASRDVDHYVRMCAAQEVVNNIHDLGHSQALDTIQRLIEKENHEWVYNEYLEFLYRKTDDIASYHDQLDLLRHIATNDASELKRWLAMDKLLRVKAKIKETPPWLEQFMKERMLTDPSNWLRAQIANGIMFMITFNPDEELQYFALQWALHTKCCDYPSSYRRAKKDSKYFPNTDQLLNPEPKGPEPLIDDPRNHTQKDGPPLSVNESTVLKAASEDRWIDRIKNHPVIVLLTILASVLTIMSYYKGD